MIELMIRKVFQNSNRIDTIVKHVNKIDNRNCLILLLLSTNLYLASRVIKNHDEKINELETEIEGIKSNLT